MHLVKFQVHNIFKYMLHALALEGTRPASACNMVGSQSGFRLYIFSNQILKGIYLLCTLSEILYALRPLKKLEVFFLPFDLTIQFQTYESVVKRPVSWNISRESSRNRHLRNSLYWALHSACVHTQMDNTHVYIHLWNPAYCSYK